MHKRILVIFLALVLLVCLCTISVSAEGVNADDDVPYIELMDYVSASPDGMIDGIVPGAFYVTGDYDFVGNFGLLIGEICAYGYEITFSYVGNRPTVNGVSFGFKSDNDFKSRFIDEANIGKIRGSFGGSVGSDFGISFYSAGCYITVHSVRIFLVNDYQIELPAELYGNGQTSYWTPGSSAIVSTTGYGTIEIDDWRNFDVVSVSATLGGFGITSVSARLIDNTSNMEVLIPFDLNYINLSDYDGDHENVLLTIACDMRNVDPATAPDSTLIIAITTAVPSGSYGYIQPTSIYGSILIESTDKYLPWLKVLTGITMLNAEDSMYQLINIFDRIQNFEASVSENFGDLGSNLSILFSDLSDSFGSFISTAFDEFSDFYLAFEQEKAVVYVSLFTQIRDSLAVNKEQEQSVQQSAQGMTSAGSSLSDLGAEMDSYTPSLSVDDISFDATSLVPALGMASAGTLASIVTSDPLIASMLLIVATLALVGFVLFGKR